MKTLRNPTALWACCILLAGAAARANDFPTLERVLYVQECMRAHPGPQFEISSKCACTLDALALHVRYNDYVTLSTLSKAVSMAGERGGEIRDAPSTAPQIKRYRELQAQAEQSCFIGTAAR
jgi:hypothetical protein